MERLESQFRLQRQTMGILAQLNDTTGDTNTGSSGIEAATGGNDVSSGPSGSTSFNDLSLPRPWNSSSSPHMLRHWRLPRRESLERTSSLDSRFLILKFCPFFTQNCNSFVFRSTDSVGMGIGSGPSTSRFQVPRRAESSNLSSYGARVFRPNIRPSEDDDSSDNESGSSTLPSSSFAGYSALRRNRLPMSRTDDLAAASGMAAASSSVPANRWRQSSPISSPRGVEQRMR